jgi:Uma2 family endonuclease
MPAIQTAKMTADQFLQLGEDPPGIRLELVDGEIEMAPSPIPKHSRAIMRLTHWLINQVEAGAGGDVFSDVDTIFGEHDVRRPDILYFSEARIHLVGDKAMEGPPDLAVEVLSPSSKQIDRQAKFTLYERGGVTHYWIVDPAKQTLEAYKLQSGSYTRVAEASGTDRVTLEPFGETPLPLGKLWGT